MLKWLFCLIGYVPKKKDGLKIGGKRCEALFENRIQCVKTSGHNGPHGGYKEYFDCGEYD